MRPLKRLTARATREEVETATSLLAGIALTRSAYTLGHDRLSYFELATIENYYTTLTLTGDFRIC